MELAAAIWGVAAWDTFVERHGEAPTCEVWLGAERVGMGCVDACARVEAECPGRLEQACLDFCGQLPRHFVDCIRNVPECEFATCNLPDPDREPDSDQNP